MSITINLNNVQPLDELLTALSDLSFSGNESLYLRVNSTADAFEFAAASGGGGGVWGSITGTLSDQTDLQNALDLKAALAGAAFTGAVSVTTSGSGATLDLTNSGSGTTLNIANSGSGSFLVVDTNKMVVSNNGNVAFDTNTLFVDAVNSRVGAGTSSPDFRIDAEQDLGLVGAAGTEFTIAKFSRGAGFDSGLKIGYSTRGVSGGTEHGAFIRSTYQRLMIGSADAWNIAVNGTGVYIGGNYTPTVTPTADTVTLGGQVVLATTFAPSTTLGASYISLSSSITGGASGDLILGARPSQAGKAVGIVAPNAVTSGTSEYIATFRSSGIYIGNATTAPSARIHVQSQGTSEIGQIIQAAAGQTANLQEWRDSAGVVPTLVNNLGILTVVNTSTPTQATRFVQSTSGPGPLNLFTGLVGTIFQVLACNLSSRGIDYSPLGTNEYDMRLINNHPETWNGNTQPRSRFLFSRTNTNFVTGAGISSFISTNENWAVNNSLASYAHLLLSFTINQQGTSNGISRGIYINPTLTSAVDFRAIETASGNVVFGNLPTSSSGLPTGAIWNNGGVLNIV